MILIQRLQHKLKEEECALQKAAQYGLQLLDGQLDLQNKLDEQRIEITNHVEVNIHTRNTLCRRGMKSRVLDSLRSDYDLVNSQQRLQWEKQESMLERNHAMELNECKNKVEKMKAELDEAQLIEKQLKHKLELQTETLRNKMEELRLVTERTHETMSLELMELQEERMELEDAKVNKIFNITLYLQIQLDQVLQQAQDPNSKGNSLFGEVEAACDLRTISSSYECTIQNTFPYVSTTMMQLQGSRAGPAHLERLQSMLSEKNSEIQALKIKLRRPEKVEVISSSPVEMDSGDGTYYTDLKIQLLNSVKDAERLGDELFMQRMKSLSESQRALELERKLFSVVRALKQSQSDNIKLQPNGEESEAHGPGDGAPQAHERPTVTPLYPPNIPKPNPALPGDSKCVRICEESPPPPPHVSVPMVLQTPVCPPLFNFGFLVFFLGFVRAITTRPPLPTLPLPFGRAVTGKSIHCFALICLQLPVGAIMLPPDLKIVGSFLYLFISIILFGTFFLQS
uniref:Spindle apparatus coiled-coil protein 1 n=1 Tax=Oncorhynchus mykiss TaxID=8022 RepID=A0A8C7QF43_ONCMY